MQKSIDSYSIVIGIASIILGFFAIKDENLRAILITGIVILLGFTFLINNVKRIDKNEEEITNLKKELDNNKKFYELENRIKLIENIKTKEKK